ncbi:MAG: glucoamylase family protein [Ginsengibacter sp.]
MKLKIIPAAHELISNMRAFFQTSDKISYLNEEPLRSELFSSEQLERFGKSLATTHKLNTEPAQDHLLKRLADNETILQEVRKLLTDSIKTKRQVTPAGEWLIDNFYLIEEHIRIAKTHFPKNYSETLPQLLDGASAGMTRIYNIVLQIISHSDGRIDIESVSSFVKAYQTVTNLQLGELWAIPLMLRLALIENIRRVSARIAIDSVDKNLADYWAGEMTDKMEKDPKNLILVVADMARSSPPLVSAFVSELIRQLRGKGPDLEMPLNWIELQLSEGGLTSAELVNVENQKQAADQVSISNSIGSLRLLSGMDWREFVETHSVVEQTLRKDNGGIYGLMDFSTRDRYRHVVELIAKKSKLSEDEIARIAIQLMQENALQADNDPRTSHVGYYLVGKGIIETKKRAQLRMSFGEKTKQLFQRHAFKFYLTSIFLITLSISAAILINADFETKNLWLLISIALLSLLCASQLAVSLVNFFSTLLVKPNLLPRMDFSKEVPPGCSTLVVVPAMLTHADEIEDLVGALEVRFLANRNNNLYFGLLTDFVDAAQEKLPEDQRLLELAQQRIKELNKKYKREEKNDLFFLFHRPRKWNPRENVWMGYERKRGKLTQLNSALRGNAQDFFSVIIGDQSIFPKIKYVITLDADTQLPMGSAWKLIGTMAHPLNHSWYDEKKKRVTKGYGILQPRVTISLPDITGSLYARMHGNEPGIDPYTRASSDVYQDLFAEGSFIGKGIYEVDIFKKVLKGAFAENQILSHDLLEGCYVRSGLLSDVQLFEKYPTSYHADMKRRSRWVRGDWQIFSWFLPAVVDAKGHLHKNPISGLSRWKIFDNIRRSLAPLSLTSLLLLDWLFLPSSLYWTLTVSAIIVFPIFITSLWNTIRKPNDVILKHHIKNSVRNLQDIIVNTLFTLICLPYEAFFSLIAIVNTLWRMLVSRKKLLEWNPSNSTENAQRSNLSASYYSMWIEPVLTLCVFTWLVMYSPAKLLIAGPILFLWLIAPFVTWYASKPLEKQVAVLTNEQNIFLQKMARKTWSFFERFVVMEDNWLPPDNFQEQPDKQIAHRTSPTNIGLSLLTSLTACDFGFITTGQLIERISNTISTMENMERYRGHFYNWYDTRSLEPLLPRYVSTVDSGNLAGHLMVLKQGLLHIPHKKIQGVKLFEGLRETLRVLTDTLKENERELLAQFTMDLEGACNPSLHTSNNLKISGESLLQNFNDISDKLNTDPVSETRWWIGLLKKQLEEVNKQLQIFTPWFILTTAPAKFSNLVLQNDDFSFVELIKILKQLRVEATEKQNGKNIPEEDEWLQLLKTATAVSIQSAEYIINSAGNLAERCNDLVDMDWNFLFDKSSNLLAIGYNMQEHRIDSSYYDLLASEARLGNFVGIAEGKLPEESWFALGRLLTKVGGYPILLSWSGSMFEYLMPLLVMPTFENTLLDQTCNGAVEWQIAYGKKTGLPWGISESGYNMINANSQYQYRAFGAPGLGLKRGLEEDSVIAPYASALALMITPQKACKNLELLSEKGFEGRHGFYEAIDYTPSRVPRGQTYAIVYSFMAHHQGMSLLSLAYLLLDKPMQKLFESEPQFKATLLLLQERIPRASTFFAHTTDIAETNYLSTGQETRIIVTPHTAIPAVQLLSNGRYHVMVTNAGGGYSRWKDLAVTRWREDSTCDNRGTFFYIRDLQDQTFWSNTYQPALEEADKYEAAFSQGRVDYHSVNNEIETHTEIVVSPEDDIEMRRIIITNRSSIEKTIEVTSYAEVVLAAPASDAMQPAFSNLFVQTEIVPHQRAIICTRRPRSAEEQSPWMFHLLAMQGKEAEEISYETDRMEFLGRGNSAANPQAINNSGPLSGNQGSVLDPIVAIRYKIKLAPDEKISIDMITGIAETKTICETLVGKYQDKHHKDRVFEMAWTHSQVVLRQINATEADAQLYGRLASSILFTNAAFRADPAILISNLRGQSGLWGYSISGDLPIVLLKIENQSNMNLVKELVQAHAYWRLKGLAVDLVIWNEEHNVYRQSFQNDIQSLIPAELRDRPGGVFVRASDQISNEDRILFQTVARINISDDGGSLADYVKRKQPVKPPIPSLIPLQYYQPSPSEIPLPKDLVFFNGLGGFARDGSEYIIAVQHKKNTPAPWVNVIANPNFGTIISESGTAYTWTENAHELRLTPWNNDPVSDTGGEAFYLRDEESGHYWSTTLLPAGGESTYITSHGFGYSKFEHIEDGIYSEMVVYVDRQEAIKFIVIKVRNQSGRPRKLSATGYTEWVLGDSRAKTAMHIHTEVDPDSGALFAKNQYNTEFNTRVAFFDVDYLKKTFTGDRAEFIGRNGNLQNPDAMSRIKLSGKIGLALDPCAAIQVPFFVADGEEQEIIFRLGAGKDANEASAIAKQFRGSAAASAALEKVKKYWANTTGALQVETPDKAINLITNGWLTYQTLSSRLWGRSGFYQSGGAFGFRDQLQDVMSLLHTHPELAREQILLCASRQFKEGDVQHWWHPPIGRGVRTRISDDYLWLPFVTSYYVKNTGDITVLDEVTNFLEGRLLNDGEESYFDLPAVSATSASLYEHCVRAIKHGLNFGVHGLPLIGTGDWNDGFDKVGQHGKGESVWLAFFLYEILIRFADIAGLHNDATFATECKNQAQQLKQNIDKSAWDGEWYKRAWFDDGTPLGSKVDEECKIDSISQSWSVLSRAGNASLVNTAMESAYKNLVQKDVGIIKLLEPAFDKSDLNPGYIKGYVPGVRENGGQYTHAAVWMIMAFAKLGDTKRVWELLNMINPVNHGKTAEEIATYKVEPYVLAADVYSRAPHAGRGGWTWYTGSAGWLYRLLTESFLGLHQEGNKLKINPCVPKEWPSFKVHYRYKKSMYHIEVMQINIGEEIKIVVDGAEPKDKMITLADDGIEHNVHVTSIALIMN